MRGILLAAAALACAATHSSAAAERPFHTPLYQNWIVNRATFGVSGGRIVNTNNNGWVQMGSQSLSDGGVRESVALNGTGATGSISYDYQQTAADAQGHKRTAVEVRMEISSDGRFVLRQSDKDEPESDFEFTQTAGQAVRLALPPAVRDRRAGGPAAPPRVLEAATLWHLLIVHGDECRKEFLPRLEALRPEWNLGGEASATEDELVKLAAVAQKPDRRQWAAWIDQLADPAYTRRLHAEQKLQEAGPVVLGYLTRLDMGRLDTEQQMRVRRVIRILSTQQGEDTPETVAATLVGDPEIWLALLSRDDEATRAAAAQQLEVILGEPVKIDPKTEPAATAAARAELGRQIEKLSHEGSRPEK